MRFMCSSITNMPRDVRLAASSSYLHDFMVGNAKMTAKVWRHEWLLMLVRHWSVFQNLTTTHWTEQFIWIIPTRQPCTFVIYDRFWACCHTLSSNRAHFVPTNPSFPGAQICRTFTQSTLRYYSEYDPWEIIYMDARAGMMTRQESNISRKK